MNEEMKAVIEAIRNSGRILITSHENPDGDALGSTLGLGLGLEKLGKEVVFYNKDGVPELLTFLPGSERIRTSLEGAGDFDLAFAVDCTGTSRAGDEFEDFVKAGRCRQVVIIDHHQTNSSSADIHLLDSGSSSTGEIVYLLLKTMSVEIDEAIAKNLYTTIVSDTGSFRYSNTNPVTFRDASELVERGVDPAEISEALFESEPLRKLRLVALVLPTLSVREGNRVASVVIDRSMFEKAGARREDTEGLVNIPRSIKGVEVAVAFREEAGNGSPFWKISFRSKGDVDVARIAERFGGGGHKKAAGCSVEGTLEEVQSKVFGCIGEELE
ncbi:MAG TPA: bifunctional oligoribonuclease/PAP phosphatase NrnA [Thermodesulfobacteriota bacterium]|nr:bifunctional oligoribonuclease/PAP phosphatase NrnA [Thermodesulfobacteriota bacterium]